MDANLINTADFEAKLDVEAETEFVAENIQRDHENTYLKPDEKN